MGEKMFWVPQSVLENLVKPVTEEVRLSAVYEAADILDGKVDRRPSLTPTAEEYSRYFNNHVTDEGLAQMAGERGYSLLKRVEVSEANIAERIQAAELPPSITVHLDDVSTPHKQDAGGEVSSLPTDGLLDGRQVQVQTDGTPRLCLGVNRDLNVTAETQRLELVLGTFNTDKAPTPHHVYRITPDELKAQMDKLVGKPIGEVGQSQFAYNGCYANFLDRLETSDPDDAWATLDSYRIEELPDSSLRVHGTVNLANRGRVMLADTNQALCSIRSVSMKTYAGPYPNITLNNVKKICAFDLVAE